MTQAWCKYFTTADSNKKSSDKKDLNTHDNYEKKTKKKKTKWLWKKDGTLPYHKLYPKHHDYYV